ncbi:MAG: response regulator [Candidatus Acidiferrum sp.]|jgi:chemotaxis response regulator CheB
MPRVFLASGDQTFCEVLRDFFQSEDEFLVCGEARDGIEAVKMAIELAPDLVVLEQETPPMDIFQTARVIKTALPEIPVFLVTEPSDMDAEKKALSSGVEAVFEKTEDDLSSLLLKNARAICGLE